MHLFSPLKLVTVLPMPKPRHSSFKAKGRQELSALTGSAGAVWSNAWFLLVGYRHEKLKVGVGGEKEVSGSDQSTV